MEMEKSKNGGSSIGGSIVAAFCIIIYLFALVQGSVRIYLSIDERKITAEKEFVQLADHALFMGRQSFMDDRFIQAMNSELASKKTIEALIITGPNGGHAFEKKTGHAIAWVNNSPRFINKLYLSNQNLYRPLAIPDVRDANIKAVASFFDFNVLLRVLKQTLLIIMIGLAISFFTIIIQLLVGKPAKSKNDIIYAPYKPAAQTAPAANRPVNQPINQPAPHQLPQASLSDAAPSDVSPSEVGPKGLYSPRTNIGWEQYTKDRLDSELHRCSATEKDLALILMEFAYINNDLMLKQAAEEAANFFTSRDLLFEYGNQGITVILPGVGFDIAISRTEKFYQRIAEKYSDSFGSTSSLKIGISSRSGRLLNADRIILEAKEALKKAKTDSVTSIIAFKSDPEKYREFIRTHS